MRGRCVELVFLIATIIVLIVPSNQFEQTEPQLGQQPTIDLQHNRDSVNDASNEARGGGSFGGGMSISQFRSSVPMRIYECLRDFNMMRCTKLFVLQKLEERKNWINTGNLTKDFIHQFFGDEERMGSLTSERFRKMSDKDLNKKLIVNFQRFFKNRDIKLKFFPGLMVKVVPSKENKLKISFKKNNKHYHEARAQDTSSSLTSALKEHGLIDNSLEGHGISSLEEDDGDGKSKHKIPKKKIKKDKISYKSTILQMAVPVMIMPAILMGTFLPFILPVLKMATLTTMIMNNTAFMAALIYAARTHVNSQQEQPINYNYGNHPIGYH